jgi:hypothetical protein
MQGGARAIGTVAEPRADSAGADPAPRDVVRRVRGSWNQSSSDPRTRTPSRPGRAPAPRCGPSGHRHRSRHCSSRRPARHPRLHPPVHHPPLHPPVHRSRLRPPPRLHPSARCSRSGPPARPARAHRPAPPGPNPLPSYRATPRGEFRVPASSPRAAPSADPSGARPPRVSRCAATASAGPSDLVLSACRPAHPVVRAHQAASMRARPSRAARVRFPASPGRAARGAARRPRRPRPRPLRPPWRRSPSACDGACEG